MAGKSKYLHFKHKRYCARIVVPKPLQEIIGTKELRKAFGADLSEAERRLPRAVAAMLDEIERAERELYGDTPRQEEPRSPITTADFGRAVWQRYTAAIEADASAHAARPGPVEVEKGLCCTNHLSVGLPVIPDRAIPRSL